MLGRGVVLNSTLGAVSMESEPGGRIEIGDDVFLNFGASIRSRARVTISRNVAVAPLCLIDDSAEGGGRPIEIGPDVWLGARVVVRGGACIGAGATITAGSEVTGIIPPGVVAGGRPARVLRLAASASERPEARR